MAKTVTATCEQVGDDPAGCNSTVTCNDCGWQGAESALRRATESAGNFQFCPVCGSDNVPGLAVAVAT